MNPSPTFGAPHPLGVRFDGRGINVAVFSETATAVDLCLFDDDGNEERVRLPERTAHVHHAHVAGIRPGQRYGLRVDGPWNPANGERHNPTKLLVDPYALAIEGDVTVGPGLTGHDPANPSVRSTVDSAAMVPKCIVVDETFDWEDDASPDTPLDRSVIYEAHVRGLSKTHPDVPAEFRGTFAGMGHPAIVNHLLRLGVTAVELLPVHHFLSGASSRASGCRTTGATRRSGSSRRTARTRPRAGAASRWVSSSNS